MPYPQFDRHLVRMKPLAERNNKTDVRKQHIPVGSPPRELSSEARATIELVADRILTARANDRPVMLTFGAHTVRNGLGPILIHLLEEGWVTHMATNGAGIIHDWEFAFQGQSCEDVAAYVREGQFGNWQETGFYINLALNVGAYQGQGYGESVGALIHREELTIPDQSELRSYCLEQLDQNPTAAAASADLLHILRAFELSPGTLSVPHPWKEFSVQAAAYRLNVPFTGHPMFGHDIIYNHPMNHGASVGRVAERDFLAIAESVSHLQGGVYMSIGSAVMSPMVFEKSMSISQNLALQRGERIDDHLILVVDLAKSHWDWSQGEPPIDNPDYYLRYNKTFHRMGGAMKYLTADNRDFLLALCQSLET